MKAKSNSFVVADPKKCIGCKICEIACFAAHSDANPTVGALSNPIIPRLHVIQGANFVAPVQCRHCEDAPCANVCAIGAIKEVNGTIVVDEKACIGCKACLIACPFGAIDLLPQYVNGKEVLQASLKKIATPEQNKANTTAYKCDLCIERDSQACIDACPKGALRLYDFESESKERSRQAALALHTL
jgi:electron transport protein HydN